MISNCFGRSHGHMPFKEFRDSGSRVKRVLTWAMSKWRASLLPFVKRRKKTFAWRKNREFHAARCFSGMHATVRFAKEIFVTAAPA